MDEPLEEKVQKPSGWQWFPLLGVIKIGYDRMKGKPTIIDGLKKDSMDERCRRSLIYHSACWIAVHYLEMSYHYPDFF